MPVISEYNRQRIIELTKDHMSQREIARLLGVSRGGVQCLLKRYREGQGTKNKSKIMKEKNLLKEMRGN